MFPNLSAEIKRHRLIYKQLAEAAEMSEKSFSSKINGKSNFTLKEMKKIQRRIPSDIPLSLDYLFEEIAQATA